MKYGILPRFRRNFRWYRRIIHSYNIHRISYVGHILRLTFRIGTPGRWRPIVDPEAIAALPAPGSFGGVLIQSPKSPVWSAPTRRRGWSTRTHRVTHRWP